MKVQGKLHSRSGPRILALVPAGASALLLLSAGGASGAEISRDVVNGFPVIIVSGQIEYGDEKRFEVFALAMPKATVALASPGGNLHAGIEIGRSIRAKGYDTAVPNLCASACALAWLGGHKRLAHAQARIGFHGAWMQRNGRAEVVSGGNALVGAYLNQLGFSPSAIMYMTSAGPQEITWLTPTDARREGIAVAWKDGTDQGARTVRADTRGAPSGNPTETRRGSRADWSGYGEWVQVASRPRLDDAVTLAKALGRQGAKVFRSDQGAYAVAVGPYPIGRGEDARDGLLGSGKASRDSHVTLGGRFDSLAWGTPPTARNTAPIYRGPGTLRDED